MTLALILLASANGVMLAICRLFNATLGLRIGNMRGSLINHVVGTIFAGALIAIGFHSGNIHLKGIPFSYFIGGCLGVLVVYINNYAVPNIGAMMMTIILISFQLLTSAVIDHYGLLGANIIVLDPLRLGGVALLINGALLVFAKK
jgi:transporter family-2 protein